MVDTYIAAVRAEARAIDLLTDASARVNDPRVAMWLLLDVGGAWRPLAARILSSPTLADDARAVGRTPYDHAVALVVNAAHAVADDVGAETIANFRAVIARHTARADASDSRSTPT